MLLSESSVYGSHYVHIVDEDIQKMVDTGKVCSYCIGLDQRLGVVKETLDSC